MKFTFIADHTAADKIGLSCAVSTTFNGTTGTRHTVCARAK